MNAVLRFLRLCSVALMVAGASGLVLAALIVARRLSLDDWHAITAWVGMVLFSAVWINVAHKLVRRLT